MADKRVISRKIRGDKKMYGDLAIVPNESCNGKSCTISMTT
ncbi:MAG TPA: hypothetical protein VLI68_06915 [Hanamia sp.]|nr:hypothetical protein [Hanamia sp.]